MIIKLLKNIRDRHNFKRYLKKADKVVVNVTPHALTIIRKQKDHREVKNDIRSFVDEQIELNNGDVLKTLREIQEFTQKLLYDLGINSPQNGKQL